MSIFTGTQSVMLGVLGTAIGTAAGFLLHAWWTRRVARMKRRIPKRWPLVARPVLSSQERLAWLWLTRAFFDHSVMIKMPVTRFTLPRTQEQGQHWYQLLSNAYCTFTVVDALGRVVGCVDVASPMRNSKRSQILKQSLLDHCGIGYVVIDTSYLPDAAEIRAEFLGERASQQRANNAKDAREVGAASEQLRASLQRQRETRRSDFSPLSRDSAGHSELKSALQGSDSHILHSWRGNSILFPLDSRKAELN